MKERRIVCESSITVIQWEGWGVNLYWGERTRKGSKEGVWRLVKAGFWKKKGRAGKGREDGTLMKLKEPCTR